MKRKNKPDLVIALKRVDKASSHLFGNIEIDVATLPCMNKPEKEKITGNFDKSLLRLVRKVAKDHRVPYTELMNDVLTQVFLHSKFKW